MSKHSSFAATCSLPHTLLNLPVLHSTFHRYPLSFFILGPTFLSFLFLIIYIYYIRFLSLSLSLSLSLARYRELDRHRHPPEGKRDSLFPSQLLLQDSNSIPICFLSYFQFRVSLLFHLLPFRFARKFFRSSPFPSLSYLLFPFPFESSDLSVVDETKKQKQKKKREEGFRFVILFLLFCGYIRFYFPSSDYILAVVFREIIVNWVIRKKLCEVFGASF